MPATLTGGPRRAGAIATGLLAGALGLAATGCGGSPPPAGTGAGTATHHPMSSPSPAMARSAAFGPGCGMVPASGMGSLHAMSMDPVITAASHDPLLSTFAADAKAAGLAGDLDSMHAVTVFAPDNSAFRELSPSRMSMMHSPSELARILTYHVVNHQVTPADLASGTPLKTLEGGSLRVSRMGRVYEVNNADVVCGNIRTANATVYVISKVLRPVH